MSEYRNFNPDDLDGDLCFKHVDAMTREDLRDKGDIARELAFRDAKIERLLEHNQSLIDASGQECACGYDTPTDICLGHTSMFKALKDEIEQLRKEREQIQQQAEIWKREARTMTSIVHECYQAVTGKTGEPGNWNGANPVREAIAELKAERDRLREQVNNFNAVQSLGKRIDSALGYKEES